MNKIELKKAKREKIIFAVMYLLFSGISFNALAAALPTEEKDEVIASGGESSYEDIADAAPYNPSNSPDARWDSPNFSAHYDYKSDIAKTTEEFNLLKFAKEGNLEGVIKLVSIGTNINCRVVKNPPEFLEEFEHCTPLILACKYGKIDIIKFLLGQENINVNAQCCGDNYHVDYPVTDAIYCIVTSKHYSSVSKDGILKLMIKHKNCKTGYIFGFLYLLIENKLNDIAEFYINHLGEDINIPSKEESGLSPLILTIIKGDKDSVILLKMLLKNKFLDINTECKHDGPVDGSAGCTALTALSDVRPQLWGNSRRSLLEISALLINHKKIDLNLTCEATDCTALHAMVGSISQGYLDQDEEYLKIIKHLLSFQRINPAKKDQNGLTIYDYVNNSSKEDAEADEDDHLPKMDKVRKMIDEFYVERKRKTSILFKAIRNNLVDFVRSILLIFTVAVNDENGDTTLQAAIKTGNKKMVQLLLNAEPKLIMMRNSITQDTALHTAIAYANTEIATLLFLCAPNLIDSPNNKKQMPIDLVVTRKDLLSFIIKSLSKSVSKPVDPKKETDIIKALMHLGSKESSVSSLSSSSSSVVPDLASQAPILTLLSSLPSALSLSSSVATSSSVGSSTSSSSSTHACEPSAFKKRKLDKNG